MSVKVILNCIKHQSDMYTGLWFIVHVYKNKSGPTLSSDRSLIFTEIDDDSRIAVNSLKWSTVWLEFTDKS